MRFFFCLQSRVRAWAVALACLTIPCSAAHVQAQSQSPTSLRTFYIDCSAATNGDGSLEHPWNSLAAAEARPFAPGDRVALARGTTCHGSFAPQGSGVEGRFIRLTAYGHGARPKIAAQASARQVLLLSNQQYWQVDSLDLSGGNTYGVFVTGNRGPLHHLYLKNLSVHDVEGGRLKNKDNGLVVVGPSGPAAVFYDVLIDGVDAAHTNQWAGILVGGGPFNFPENAPLNRHVRIVNSTVHDIYGDGIVLFRDQDSSIRTSAAWQTGMQPTQDIGTPNAIWTWTCVRCTVADNEAFLTDSPGVDGGAYDIDWDNTDNTIARNYGHDTQGYCIAVFGAGYVTANSEVRGNLCIDNGMSPRLAASCGAVCITTWNDGTIRGLRVTDNRIQWNPRAPGAPAIVENAQTGGSPIVFSHNAVESAPALIYRVNSSWAASQNVYRAAGNPLFDFADWHELTLSQLQSAGNETGSSLEPPSQPASEKSIRLDVTIDPALDEDGLLRAELRAQLLVLRSLASQYAPSRLKITLHLPSGTASDAATDALKDMEGDFADRFELEHDAASTAMGAIRMKSADGRLLKEWRGFTNAATLGGAVRALAGAPDYSPMQKFEAGRIRE
jgi:hypothetical protein